MRKLKYLLIATILCGCEEAIVESITSNTTTEDVDKPSTELNIGSEYKGNLSGTAWRMTSQKDWPDTMLIIAFGSNGRYDIELININPNQGWPNGPNTLQYSGEWSLVNSVLSLEANTKTGYVEGKLRKVNNNTLCWDLEEFGACGVILVRIKK